MSKDIDLKSYSIDELKDLVAASQKEINRKQRSRIKELRSKMEQLAGTVDMTAEEVLSYGGKKAKPLAKLNSAILITLSRPGLAEVSSPTG